jgi:predicted phage baseplate assembly protein
VDDALYVGLSNPVPSCAVAIRLGCRTEGVGVDPNNPPLAWEAWDGHRWVECERESDGTLGFNQAGDVVIHVPRGHEASTLPGTSITSAWLRCRLVEPARGQASYSDPPRLSRVEAFTIGGSALSIHARATDEELLGLSDGVPAQRFTLRNAPLVSTNEPVVLEVATTIGWVEWTRVSTFASSTADDKHFMLDAALGEVVLGPAVRRPDGTVSQHGAIPDKGTAMRVRRYWSGGGRTGNVAAGTITQLKSSVPYVTRVQNRHAASGGVDGETVEEAKARAPLMLRSRGRAVTTEDHEWLAREVAPELARVRCIDSGPEDPGAVRLLLVPHVTDDDRGAPALEQLVPRDETLSRVHQTIDDSRPIGSRIAIGPPEYVRVVVVVTVRAGSRTDLGKVRDASVEVLNSYLHPTRGGKDGLGWPFGRSLHGAEIQSVLLQVPEVDVVDEVKLFWLDPDSGERSEESSRLDLAPGALFFLADAQVRVVEV